MNRSFSWTTGKASTIALAAGRLEARCWGPPPDAAPTLVLLHEGLGSVSLWRDFPEELAAATGCGVLAYSRFGYGHSDPKPLPWPLYYSTDEAVEVLPLVLDAVAPRSTILVGQSDGATIAAIHAGSCPHASLAGIVMMAPHFFAESVTVPSIAAARRAYEEGRLRERLARHHRDPDNAFHGWNDTWSRPDIGDWNVEDVLASIRVPVLALQGVDDEYGTRAQIAAVVRDVPGAVETRMIAGCGHAPQFEAASVTRRAIADFVKDVAGISPGGA